MVERRALLVGINSYPKVDNHLTGCHNDMDAMAELLAGEKLGFQVRTLPDPGREKLLEEMERLLRETGRGDVVVFFYSGHGSFLEDTSSGERFESIVPSDSGRGEQENLDVFDQELDLWVRRLNGKTPHVTLIFDCCYAGDVTRGPGDVRQLAGEARPSLWYGACASCARSSATPASC